ncbi:hypothetical protein DJ017_10045 [Phenylobacterium soli]|uniref:Uncharacterized protein n=2 Tax=Phenylobacterium soli TaxID=2170551 RepID=A0A328AK46_9CAUL|nr:hypothetical protein DJ017_10045 [Phenylobacterium soli]
MAELGHRAEPRSNPLVQQAPGPEAPDVKTRAGSQRGMALALIGGGVFWAAVAAAVYALTR